MVGESMDKPLVSVIIPAYNCAKSIAGAVDSALMQNVPLEIIVINDCSLDNLDEAMSCYGGNPAVHYVKNEQNMGAAKSRNRGVQLAEGKYIAYLDSDDLWREGKLARQLALLESTGAVLCCTARELMTPEGEYTGRVIPVKEEISYGDLLKHNSINCSSVLIHREAALEFPMAHEDSHEDYITWMKVLNKYGNAVGINEPLLLYRLSNTGKSGSKLKSAGMTYQAYRYMGFSTAKSVSCFCSYALHGAGKYLGSYVKNNKDTKNSGR
jgi:teichuronic acid biosynthesis glycosyltransferase TuaG